MSKEVKDFLGALGSKKYETSAYKPSSNGSVERFHRYLNMGLGQCVNDEPGSLHKDWDEHIESVLFTYRTTPIDGLDVTPFEVMYGRNPNLPIDNMVFRENYDRPILSIDDHLGMLHDYQKNVTGA